MKNGNSPGPADRAQFGGGGGGALFAEGGQLKVVNSRFLDNRCYKSGPDLGGAAIRALAQYRNRPVYITSDTFSGGRCSNGGALSSIGVYWVVLNSVHDEQQGHRLRGQPGQRRNRGRRQRRRHLHRRRQVQRLIAGTVIRNNSAREGGGAVFFVRDNNTGSLTIKNSTLHDNPSAVFWTRPFPGIFFHSTGHPRVVDSTIS